MKDKDSACTLFDFSVAIAAMISILFDIDWLMTYPLVMLYISAIIKILIILCVGKFIDDYDQINIGRGVLSYLFDIAFIVLCAHQDWIFLAYLYAMTSIFIAFVIEGLESRL